MRCTVIYSTSNTERTSTGDNGEESADVSALKKTQLRKLRENQASVENYKKKGKGHSNTASQSFHFASKKPTPNTQIDCANK